MSDGWCFSVKWKRRQKSGQQFIYGYKERSKKKGEKEEEKKGIN